MWVTEYNTDRPHQALDMATPGDRFRLTPWPRMPHRSLSTRGRTTPASWVLRRVASNGLVSVDNQMFSVGNAYKAQLVDVFVDDTVIQVWSKNHLIKTVARSRSGRVRKVRADGLHVKRQPTTVRQASAGT